MFKYKKIKQLRNKNNWSKPELSRRLLREGVKVSGRTLFNWELGKYKPNADDIEGLVYVFDVPVSDFFSIKTRF